MARPKNKTKAKKLSKLDKAIAKATTAPLHVVLTKEQHADFKALAKAEDMTLGELLLRMYAQYTPRETEQEWKASIDAALVDFNARLGAIEGGGGAIVASDTPPDLDDADPANMAPPTDAERTQYNTEGRA